MLKATHLIDLLSIACVIGFIFFNRDKAQTSVKMPLWCITADINNLKVINDTYGHSAGDVAISQTARIFSECVEHVYRTGGDEFVMFLYNAGEDSVLTCVNHIRGMLESYNVSHDIRLNVALGWDCLGADHDSVIDLYMRADKLMYEEKKENEGTGIVELPVPEHILRQP